MFRHAQVQHVDEELAVAAGVDSKARWISGTLLTAVIIVMALVSPTPAIAAECVSSAQSLNASVVQK